MYRENMENSIKKDDKKEIKELNLAVLSNDIKYIIGSYYASPLPVELLKEIKEVYKYIKWKPERKRELKLFLRNNVMRCHTKSYVIFNYIENLIVKSIKIDIYIAINLCINIFNSTRFGSNLIRTDHFINKYYIKFINEKRLIDYNKYNKYFRF